MYNTIDASFPGYCGAHVAVEAFESRARILNAKENQPFPTLSILHLTDQLRDAMAAATTTAARQRVRHEETPFELRRHTGVVTMLLPPDKASQGTSRYFIDSTVHL
jgi:hypothetical protein